MGEHLYKIEQSFHTDIMVAVATFRGVGVDFKEQRVNEFNINCQFQRVPWKLFSISDDNDQTIEKKRQAALTYNLPVSDGVDACFQFPAP